MHQVLLIRQLGERKTRGSYIENNLKFVHIVCVGIQIEQTKPHRLLVNSAVLTIVRATACTTMCHMEEDKRLLEETALETAHLNIGGRLSWCRVLSTIALIFL